VLRAPCRTCAPSWSECARFSSRPVIYAELPGAHHDFDMFESIRSAAVSEAVEEFTARVR
jgi:hypothetical protein